MTDQLIKIPGEWSVEPEGIMRAMYEGEGYDWGGMMLYLDRVHAMGVTGKDVSVCVLDTGLYSHPDLPDSIKSKNFVIGQDVYDRVGHSTHVRGIINMQPNGKGLIGVAPGATVHIAKVLGDNGSGKPTYLIEAMKWAMRELKVDVINLSLAFGSVVNRVNELIIEAEKLGIIIVAASGNSGNDVVSFPASHPYVIGVGATDDKDKLALFSNRGDVNVVAPGVNVRSTWVDGNYRNSDGTSMATPYVSGLVALIIEWFKLANGRKPNVDEVKTILCTYAKDLGIQGKDTSYGCGRITTDFTGVEKINPIPGPSKDNKGCLNFWKT